MVAHFALPAKIHPFRAPHGSARGSRLSQGNAWQKCDFAALYLQLIKVVKSRIGSTLISDFCTFPSIRALLCGAFKAQLIKRKIKWMKGSAVFNHRYPSIFRFGRINAKGNRLIAASFHPLSNVCVLIIPPARGKRINPILRPWFLHLRC